MSEHHEAVGSELLEVLEFQYLDPETGAWMSMVADETGFRPSTASEVMDLGLRHGSLQVSADLPCGQARVEALELELDEFIAKYTHSFPDTDDCDVLAPAM